MDPTTSRFVLLWPAFFSATCLERIQNRFLSLFRSWQKMRNCEELSHNNVRMRFEKRAYGRKKMEVERGEKKTVKFIRTSEEIMGTHIMIMRTTKSKKRHKKWAIHWEKPYEQNQFFRFIYQHKNTTYKMCLWQYLPFKKKSFETNFVLHFSSIFFSVCQTTRMRWVRLRIFSLSLFSSFLSSTLTDELASVNYTPFSFNQIPWNSYHILSLFFSEFAFVPRSNRLYTGLSLSIIMWCSYSFFFL